MVFLKKRPGTISPQNNGNCHYFHKLQFLRAVHLRSAKMKIHFLPLDKALLSETGYVNLDMPAPVPPFCDSKIVRLLDLPMVHVQNDGQITNNFSRLEEHWTDTAGHGVRLDVHERAWQSQAIQGNGTLIKYEVDDVKQVLQGFSIKGLPSGLDNYRMLVCVGALVFTSSQEDAQPRWVAAQLLELGKNEFLH
jgi:hypothetical protein